jgi:threonine dehydrogenase-like Zn-dependent dehydrogenase
MWPGLHYPLPAGMPIHECVGTIEESHSPRFDAGDVVVALPERDQGLAEYYAAEASRAVPVPELLSPSETSALIQPLSTVIHAFDKLGDVTDRTAVVVGLGPIGLLAIWLLRQYGARAVGVDPIPWRCEAARRLGADQTIEVHSDRLVSLIAEGSKWEPADICVEAVGQQTRTINDCLHLLKNDGLLLALGIPLEPVYPLEFMHLFRQNLQIITSVTPSDEKCMSRAANLVADHERELAFLITHRFGLDNAAEAYTLYEARAGDHQLKVLIDGSSWQTVTP